MSKNNQRNTQSSPYDWFKTGSGSDGGKKKPTSGWRSFLKILKLIAYSSLLILSLVGCVQSMVIRTSRKTGSGLEFYKSHELVAPQTTTFTIATKYKDKLSVLAVDAEKNYWVQDPTDLKNIHSTIKDGGGTFDGDRAWKAKNQAIRFEKTLTNFGGNSKSGIADGTSDKVFAVSTSQTTYKNLYDFGSKGKSKTFYALLPTGQNKDKKANTWDQMLQGNIYSKGTWALKEVIYTPPTTSGNASAKDLQKDFTYDSYYELLAYIQNMNPKITPTFNKTTKKGNAIYKDITEGKDSKKQYSDETKAYIDSYLTVVAATGWGYQDSGSSSLSQIKSSQKALLSWDAVQEERAITSWGAAWHLGPFYALFVYPMSLLTRVLITTLPVLAGWGSVITIFLVVLILRSFAYALSFKSTLQQVKQQEIQAKIAQINAKYEPYKGNRQMDNRKKQETMAIYKKEGISPLGSFASNFLTMPIFLSMWRVIGSMPYLKSTSVAGVVFAETSYQQVLSGHFQYLVVMVLAASMQVGSILLPRWLSKRRDRRRSNIHQQQALKKQNRTQTIMAIVFAGIAAIMPAGVSIYMMFTAMYQIGQNSLNHKIIKWQSIRQKRAKGVKI